MPKLTKNQNAIYRSILKAFPKMDKYEAAEMAIFGKLPR